MKILLTGGCGYIGTNLTNKLLEEGHRVIVVDIMWFGNYLNSHKNLSVIQADIRDIDKVTMEGIDSIIHLANIANDPTGNLNSKLTWEVNALASKFLVEKAIDRGVEQFIFASSGSVYGIKEEQQVTEDLQLMPISDYNKSKMISERVLLSYQDKITVQVIRPATVCGYSPRQRLDVVVNILTNLAYHKREISVFGGHQLRPNIHIADMVEIYVVLLNASKEKIAGEIFNGGYENYSVIELAETVRGVIGDDVVLKTTPTDDNRSYHVSSKKIAEVLGFTSSHTIRDAVADLREAFDAGLLPDSLNDERYFNIKRMQSLNLK